MGKECFPISSDLMEWGGFYHFFHYISSKSERSMNFRQHLQMLLPLYCGIKLSMLSVTLVSFDDNRGCQFIGKIFEQLISLEFLGHDFINILLFSSVLIFTIILIYYYHRMDRMILHHSTKLINFIIQEISPLFSNYSASYIQIEAEDIYNNHRHYFLLSIAVFTYIILAVYTFIGATFRGAKPSITSISHSFWKHEHYFYLTQVPNIVQQIWIVAHMWEHGLILALSISLFASLSMFIWCASIPFITEQSNIFATNVFGLTTTFLILQILKAYDLISSFTFLLLLILSIMAWFIFLGKVFMEFFAWIIIKQTRFETHDLFDPDNVIQLPRLRPRLFLKLIRLLFVRGYKDIHAILVAAIENESNHVIVLECSKMLMVHSIIPYHLRQKIREIDIKQYSFISKPLLCEIQYFIDKLKINPVDVENSIAIMEDMKQKTKIALYAFSNSLCENLLKKQKYTCALNYALTAQRLMDMAEYALEGNPLSMELNLCFADYLNKVSGDFIRNVELRKQAVSIKTSFIKTDDDARLSMKINSADNISLNTSEDLQQILSHQVALDNISHCPLILISILAVLFGILFFFPVVSIEDYLNNAAINPNYYFNHHHSPVHFKIYFAITMLQTYMDLFNCTERCKVCFFEYPISIAAMQQYLNNIRCPVDNKPIFNGTSSKAETFSEDYYLFMAKKNITYETNLEDYLRESYYEMDNLTTVFDSIIERFLMCSKYIKDETNLLTYIIPCAVSLVIFLLFTVVVYCAYKPTIYRIVDIFGGIESQTLEEFRSNLFITIHHQNSSTFEQDLEVDNDGALEMEEIEAEDNAHIGQTNYNDLIEQSVHAPVAMRWFDPAIPGTLIIYLFILFAVRYLITPMTSYVYHILRQQYIQDNLVITEEINNISSLFIQLDTYFPKIGGVDEVKLSKITVNDHWSHTVMMAVEKWNDFLDTQNNMTKDEKISAIINITNLFPHIFHHMHTDYKLFQDTIARYAETLHWIITFFLFFIYIALMLRFISAQKLILKNLKHLVLILHSKYASTVSIMINRLSFENYADKEFSIDKSTEIITSQISEVVIFFDNDLFITGMNQQASAEFGKLLNSYKVKKLDQIIPTDCNKEFYNFITSMSSPLGIHARKHFEFICQTKISTRTRFTGTLIPLTTGTGITFSIIMRDYTTILNMKEELSLLNKSVHSLLNRLVPPYITDVMMSNHMKDVFISQGSAVAAMCLKPSQEIVPQDSDILDDCDITQVCISIVDKVLGKYRDISRIRTFNGNFLFITSLFNDDEDENKDMVAYLLSFLEEVASEINKYMMFKMLVSCTISYGGPNYAFITGISRTMFDVLGNELTVCFDNLDIVPSGKIIFTHEAYEKMKDHSIISLFIPPRPTKKRLYIMNNYLGMNFNSAPFNL